MLNRPGALNLQTRGGPKFRQRMTREEKLELLRSAKNGNDEAITLYARMNRGLMDKIVAIYAKWVPEDEVDDLRQEAYMGLLKGIGQYDTEKSNMGQPETYIFWWVRAYVTRYAQTHGCAATSKLVPLSQPVYDDAESGNEPSLGDTLEYEGPSPYDTLEQDDTSRFMHNVTKQLLPKEQEIVRLRMLSDESETLSTIGTQLGLSRERVRQVEGHIMRKMERLVRHDMRPPRERRLA